MRVPDLRLARPRGNRGSQYEAVSREQNLVDVVAAYDVIASNPDVDNSAIAVVGSSYGGYLAAVLRVHARRQMASAARAGALSR